MDRRSHPHAGRQRHLRHPLPIHRTHSPPSTLLPFIANRFLNCDCPAISMCLMPGKRRFPGTLFIYIVRRSSRYTPSSNCCLVGRLTPCGWLNSIPAGVMFGGAELHCHLFPNHIWRRYSDGLHAGTAPLREIDDRTRPTFWIHAPFTFLDCNFRATRLWTSPLTMRANTMAPACRASCKVWQ